MLHTVNKSPFERASLDSCLRVAPSGGAVLLIEDGVYGALANSAAAAGIEARKGELSFYVLGPDLAARGVQDGPLIDGFEVVDYGGFVDLVEKHEQTQAWL